MTEQTILLPRSRQLIVDLKIKLAKEREYIVHCPHQFYIVTDRGNRCLSCKEAAK